MSPLQGSDSVEIHRKPVRNEMERFLLGIF